MPTPQALPAQLRTYLEAVERQLAGLPPADRAELVAPIAQRLAELADHGSTATEIEQQFGPPARVAADLLGAAGYPLSPDERTPGRGSLVSWMREQLDRPAVVAVVEYVVSLRPAWWALRGYLLLGGVLALLGPDEHRLHTIGYYNRVFTEVAPPNMTPLWLVVPAAAIAASIVLGLRSSRLSHRRQLAVLGLDAAAVVVLLVFPTWWLAPAGAAFAGLVQ
jgi:hypothetical protein